MLAVDPWPIVVLVYDVYLTPVWEAMPRRDTCACILVFDPVLESGAHKLVPDPVCET